MDKHPPKRKGGAGKLREKKIKNLQTDASKCAKISDMFGAVVAASTSSALPEVEEEGEVAGYTEKQKQHHDR